MFTGIQALAYAHELSAEQVDELVNHFIETTDTEFLVSLVRTSEDDIKAQWVDQYPTKSADSIVGCAILLTVRHKLLTLLADDDHQEVH